MKYEDNITFKGAKGEKVDNGAFFLLTLIRWFFMLLTFPIRAFIYFLNPFPTKKGTPRQIKIRR